MNKINLLAIGLLICLLFVAGCLYFYNGAGGMDVIAPDYVKAGDPVAIKVVFSVTAGKINGRYKNIFLHYRLLGENNYKKIQPVMTDLPDNYKEWEAKTKNKGIREAYEFTIPPYPVGTAGEIEYWVEAHLDGYGLPSQINESGHYIYNNESRAIESRKIKII